MLFRSNAVQNAKNAVSEKWNNIVSNTKTAFSNAKNAVSSANHLIFWAPNGRYSVKIPLDEQNKPGKTAYCDGWDIPSSGNLGKTLAGYSPLITGILEADWSADSQTVILICGASDGGSPWYFTYDVQKNQVTEIHHEPK